MLSKKYTLLNLLISCSTILFGQTATSNLGLNNVIPSPPNATAFEKYINQPVNYYTGIPQITIPIYEIKVGDLQLPISLNYHAGGIKVDEIASNVGLGWSLFTGGQVSRNVVGLPDDVLGVYSGYLNQTGDIHVNNYADQFISYASGKADSKPDLFYFSAGNESGKFVLNKDLVGNKVCLLPFKKIKIEHLGTNGNVSAYDVATWKITLPNGTVYIFDQFEETFTQSYLESWSDLPANFNSANYTIPPGYVEPVPKHKSVWYLSKITSVKGDEILFEYDFPSTDVSSAPKNMIGVSEVFSFSVSPSTCGQSNTNKIGVQYQQISQRRLKRISFRSGEILFQKGVARCDFKGDNVVDNIIVNSKLPNGNYVQLKKFQFNYSYLDGTTLTPITGTEVNSNYNKRLILTSIGQSNQGLAVPPYKFDYYTDKGLPNRFSFSQDHWGYYNAVNNSTLVPSMTVPLIECKNELAKANSCTDFKFYWNIVTNSSDKSCFEIHKDCWQRDLVIKYAEDRSCGSRMDKPQQQGTLKAVTFPTGGKREFEYEPNDIYFSDKYPLTSKTAKCENGYDDETLEFNNINRETIFTIDNHGRASGSDLHIEYLNIFANSTTTYPKLLITKMDNTVVYDSHSYSSYNVQPMCNHTTEAMFKVSSLPNGTYKLKVNMFPGWDGSNKTVTYNTCYAGMPTNTTTVIDYGIKVSWKEADENQNYIVGGLRIKKIKTAEPIKGQISCKAYSYRNASALDRSSGVSVNFPELYNYMRPHDYPCTNVGTNVATFLNLSSSINSPIVSTQGACVGYGNVDESFGENMENGKKNYKYYTAADFPDPVVNYYPWGMYDSKDWKRGMAKEESTYKKSNSDLVLINKVAYEYNFYDPDPAQGASVNPNLGAVKGITVGIPLTKTAYTVNDCVANRYTLYSGYCELKKKSEYKYE
ncbi:MAG TPA: hypothetical protein VF691_21245 [Cytophagaceae bacterium]